MAVLSPARNNGALAVLLLVAQLLLMSASVRRADGVTQLESWMLSAGSPFVSAGRAVGGGVAGVTGGLGGLFRARSQNADLAQQLVEARAEAGRAEHALAENERLRRLLGMREAFDLRAIGASVVVSVQGSSRMIVVDRGADHGVRPDQAVVAWGGVVGRVVAVAPGHAKVWLATDPNSAIAARVARSGAAGLVYGGGPTGLELRYVPTYADVMHGDRVVTTGQEGIFPAGLGLGAVVAIDPDAQGTQTIALAPALDFAGLADVLIVLERPPEIEDPL